MKIDLNEFDAHIHKEMYKHTPNKNGTDKIRVFNSINVRIVNNNELKDSFNFKNIGVLDILLRESEHFDDKKRESVVNGINSQLGENKNKPFMLAFYSSADYRKTS